MALRQLQARGEGERSTQEELVVTHGGTCARSKREEGARGQGGAVLSSFSTTHERKSSANSRQVVIKLFEQW